MAAYLILCDKSSQKVFDFICRAFATYEEGVEVDTEEKKRKTHTHTHTHTHTRRGYYETSINLNWKFKVN